MKRCLVILLSLLICFSIFGTVFMLYKQQSKEEEITCDKISILSIGNSFSVDGMQYIYQIAEDLGVKEITLGNLFIGGCSLETHLSNAKNDSAAYTYFENNANTNGVWKSTSNVEISTAVTSREWDYVLFQQASGYSGVSDTYDDLEPLIEIVKPLCPKSTFGWHMTWAYQNDSTHSQFSTYDNNQATMYSSIVEAVKKKVLTNKNIAIVIPCGTAIQNARTSVLGDTLTRDGFHLSFGVGRYIASLTYVATLTKLDISNVKYVPDNVTEQEKSIAIESVKNALSSSFKVTKSSIK